MSGRSSTYLSCVQKIFKLAHIWSINQSWATIALPLTSMCSCRKESDVQILHLEISSDHLQERGSPAHTWRFSSNGVRRACMQPYQLSDPSDIMMMIDDGTAKIIVTMVSCPSVCARLIWWFICWGAFRTKTCIMYMGDPTAIKGDWQGLQQASSPALCRTNWQLAALPFSRAGFHLTKSMLSSSGKRGRGLIIIGVKNQVGWWVTSWWHWLHPD